MKRPSLARYFIASILLLLIVVSAYGLSESRRLQQELLCQAEAKGMALAETMEASAKNAILGNSLLEEMVSQRLFDNARLIDQLLLLRPMDRALLQEISAMNRLQKAELLDREGRPWIFPALPTMQRSMHESCKAFLRYDYPGNIRELENITERVSVITRNDVDGRADLPISIQEPEVEEGSSKTDLPVVVERLERQLIREALTRSRGVQTRAAEQLGITERNLRYKLKKYGLQENDPRGKALVYM